MAMMTTGQSKLQPRPPRTSRLSSRNHTPRTIRTTAQTVRPLIPGTPSGLRGASLAQVFDLLIVEISNVPEEPQRDTIMRLDQGRGDIQAQRRHAGFQLAHQHTGDAPAPERRSNSQPVDPGLATIVGTKNRAD